MPLTDSSLPPCTARAILGVMRIKSLDVARGAVMVLMAVDHVRVYAGVPAGGPEPTVFFTRWITHFCAPAFVFLAGSSAYLKGGAKTELAKWLMIRGLWLVLLELTVLRFGWTFNFDYGEFTFAGVIWAIGWSMVALGALVFLPVPVIAAIGLIIIFGHNALRLEDGPVLLRVLYTGGGFEAGPATVRILYTLIPWIGVMAAGYAFGAIVHSRRACVAVGLGAIALFIVLRATNFYGNPRPWEGGFLPFLHTAKYPASLQFLLMTLGPLILAIPFLKGPKWLEVFGQVPFFYYVLHIPLIHLVALLISLVRTPESTWWLFANHPMMPPEVPPGYRWSLGLLYLVTAVVVIALYFPCRWYARAKREHPRRWMRYI